MRLKHLLAGSLLFASFTASAQAHDERPHYFRIIKLNALALPLKNASGQFELLLSKKVSAALGFRYMPSTGIPFKGLVSNWADENEDTKAVVNRGQVSNFAVTPEVRFYLGKHGYGQGFYIAPYYRFVRFDSDYIPVNYTASGTGVKRTLTVTGDVSAHNGGLLLGAQWLLGQRFTLDWWIVGAHFGGGSGSLTGRPDIILTPAEQAQIKENLDDVDIPLVNKTVSVSANRVTVDFDGAFGGMRSGLCVGFRF